MESQAALVGAERRVELNAVAAVDLEVAGIVLPDDAELDDTLGDGGDLEGGAELGPLLEEGAVLESEGELCGEALSDRVAWVKECQAVFSYPCTPARTRARGRGARPTW